MAVSIALKHLQEETPPIRAQFSNPTKCGKRNFEGDSKDSLMRYQSADEM